MLEEPQSLEKNLTAAEVRAEVLLKTAGSTLAIVKAYRRATREGDLSEMRKTMEALERSIATLTQDSVNVREGWDLQEETYLASAKFRSELIEVAKSQSLEIFDQDGTLYCYPITLRILPSERAVLVDKKKKKKIRPSLLIKNLKDLQKRPPHFKPETFLEILFSAYSKAMAMRREGAVSSGSVIALSEIYDLLTPLPSQAKDYTRQDLARDIYSLDRSGLTKTKDGFVATFPASTGTKSVSQTISVITPTGQEKKYYGISFSAPDNQLWP